MLCSTLSTSSSSSRASMISMFLSKSSSVHSTGALVTQERDSFASSKPMPLSTSNMIAVSFGSMYTIDVPSSSPCNAIPPQNEACHIARSQRQSMSMIHEHGDKRVGMYEYAAIPHHAMMKTNRMHIHMRIHVHNDIGAQSPSSNFSTQPNPTQRNVTHLNDCKVFNVSLDGQFQQRLFVNLRRGDLHLALTIVHEEDGSLLRNLAAALVDGGLDVGGSTVGVVRQHVDDHRSSAEAVCLECGLTEISGRCFGGALDGSVDVIHGHVVGLGLLDDIGETAVGVGIRRSAALDGHDDLLPVDCVDLGLLGIGLGLGGCTHCCGTSHEQRGRRECTASARCARCAGL
mmetsp:Transcript_21843/g.60822  ORF Transcript_21843/g.60822 Transcript_21843/m.60822 type:complete len:345 (+) Transcript_21843:415-1449(+)